MDKIDKIKITKKEIEFLRESNAIEQEHSNQALRDATKAWEYAKKDFPKTKEEFAKTYIPNIHYLLLNNLRPDIRGQYRTCNVSIGGKIKKFISISKFEEEMEAVFGIMIKINKLLARDVDYRREITKGINIIKKKDLGKLAKDLHVAFEESHPFEDGNGRVGRILMNVHRLQLGLPILIIHEGEEQMEYYKWFEKMK